MGHVGKVRKAREHTITHDPVSRTFGDMEVVRPSSQVGHVEGHVELKVVQENQE